MILYDFVKENAVFCAMVLLIVLNLASAVWMVLRGSHMIGYGNLLAALALLYVVLTCGRSLDRSPEAEEEEGS